MNLLRKILFYLFCLAFVVLTPMLVFYALGYWFNPHEPQGIIKTGLIYVSSVPREATVYLDEKKIKETTPFIIRDLVPGKYQMKLERSQYDSWTRDVVVQPGRATVFDKVILIPRGIKNEILSVEKFEALISAPDNEWFLLRRSRDAGGASWLVYDAHDEHAWEPDFGDLTSEALFLRSFLVPESDYGLFIFEDQGRRIYLGGEIGEQSAELKTLPPSLFPDSISDLTWSPDEERYLFVYGHDAVSRIDTESLMVTPQLLQNVRGFGIWNKEIYALTGGGTLVKSNLADKQAKMLMHDPDFFHALFGEGAYFQIHFLKKKIALFLGSDGRLIGNQLPYLYADSGVLDLNLYPKAKKVLVVEKTRLGILDFAEADESEHLFEKGPKIRWIFERGSEIRQTFWLYDDSHLLFRDREQVFLINLWSQGEPEKRRLFNVKKGTSIHYSEDSGKIYYLDAETGFLMSFEILPKEEILFLPFPDLDLQEKPKEPNEKP